MPSMHRLLHSFAGRTIAAGALAAIVVLLLILGYGGWRYRALQAAFVASQEGFASSSAALGMELDELGAQLAEREYENTALAEALEIERTKNEQFEERISGISKTVGTLDKLAKTDPELLQKYSKVYFLNENYFPAGVTDIDPQYRYDASKQLQIHAQVSPYLQDLLDEASEEDVELRVISAYRSFGEQTVLKQAYRSTFGSGANAFSADQGYSEHQLGTTVDFTTSAVGASFTGFEDTAAYAWLLKNAHRFGFILSYPAGNAHYQFEPWHWRFVGTDLARHLYSTDTRFYDMDQRSIDPYLVSIFD